MPTLPVRKTAVQMNGDDHAFLVDDRFNDFANQVFGYLSSDLTPENVFHALELACAYEYDCTRADISSKPDKWIID